MQGTAGDVEEADGAGDATRLPVAASPARYIYY